MKLIIIIFVFLLFGCGEDKTKKQNDIDIAKREIKNLDEKDIIKFIDDYMKYLGDFNKTSKFGNINEGELILAKLSSKFYSKEMNIITFKQVTSGAYMPSGTYQIKNIERTQNEILVNLKLAVISKYDHKQKKSINVAEEIDDKLVLILENNELRISTYFQLMIGIGI
jgi:hypothetical protein